MRKFKVTVTRTVEYEVEVDETFYNDETRKDWEGTFWKLDQDDNAEAFACALAEQSVRLGVNQNIEGFACVMQDKDQAERYKQYHDDINDKMFIREVDDYIESESEEVEDFSPDRVM